jgi:hypothetical protein
LALGTFSAFYLSYTIDATNNIINFDEGGGELSATVSPGIFSATDFATAIQTALNSAGALVYTVTFNRSDRTITISATGTFSLLASSGTQISVSPWNLMGYSAIDLTGASTYTGDSPSGEAYENQFWLQDYTGPGEYIEKVDSSVNESTGGEIEVVSFGERQFLEMTFKFITDIAMDGQVIKNNPSGVADAKAFFNNIIDRGNFEFMPDVSDKNTFYKVKLESTPSSQSGTGYRLREMVSQNLPGFYEIGPIKLRVVE